MYLIRDIMYCKPGKVRPMVEKFVAMSKLGEKHGGPRSSQIRPLGKECGRGATSRAPL